jgi:dUTP pyrophosphatase
MDFDTPSFRMFSVQRTDSRAITPKKATSNSAGFDLYSIENLTLKSGERCVINLGLKMAIPEGYYGRVAPRSGLALKYGIDVMGGVIDIDNDYRGEVKVILINHGSEDFVIHAEDRIAQLILEKYYTEEFVTPTNSLLKTLRGDGGFGSTGN